MLGIGPWVTTALFCACYLVIVPLFVLFFKVRGCLRSVGMGQESSIQSRWQDCRNRHLTDPEYFERMG